MIKARRKVNKAFIVNNIRLCRDIEGSPIYVDLLTGKSYGFYDRRRLKLKHPNIYRDIEGFKEDAFIAGRYPSMVRVSG